jgi:hypothetical protein
MARLASGRGRTCCLPERGLPPRGAPEQPCARRASSAGRHWHRMPRDLALPATGACRPGGRLWLVGGLTLAIGVLLAATSGLALAVVSTSGAPNSFKFPVNLLALTGLGVGLAQLWTGIVYPQRSRCADQGSSDAALRRAGRRALAAALTLVTAEMADTAFIARRLAPLDSKAPDTWEPTFRSLPALRIPLRGTHLRPSVRAIRRFRGRAEKRASATRRRFRAELRARRERILPVARVAD